MICGMRKFDIKSLQVATPHNRLRAPTIRRKTICLQSDEQVPHFTR